MTRIGLPIAHFINRLLWLLAVAVLAACGDGDGDSGAPPPSAPTTITAAPQSATVPEGSTASFSVVAEGSGTLRYQWRKDGSPISGATAATHTTAVNTLADSGALYTVIVSGDGGTATSAAAVLTVAARAPVITQQPQPVSVSTGASATFSVQATGSAPLIYQWARNGVDIVGATADSYVTPPAQATDDGATYRVTVRNTGGVAESAGAALTVTPAPTPPTLAAGPQAAIVNVGQAATFTVNAQGSAPLRYQWQKNGTALMGATASTYTTPAAVFGDNGTSYAVLVSNDVGEVLSASATLTVLPPAPVITQQPTALTVVAGQAAAFSVTATGEGTLGYQWSRDGIAIGGATQAGYTLASTTQADNAANFTVTVTNAGGSVVSNVAILSVVPPAQPPAFTTQPQPQSVTVGQSASFAVTVTGTPPFSYQWQRDGMNIAGATTASYTTPATQLADNGRAFRVVVSNVTGTAVTSQPATLTVNPDGPTITAQPQSTTVLIGRQATFSVSATASNAPVRYQWRRNGADIAGETGRVYTIARAAFADHNALFSVVVTDGGNRSVVSNTATLGVTPIALQNAVASRTGVLTRNADGSVWMVWAPPGIVGGPYTLAPILMRDSSGFVRTGFAQIASGFQHALAVDGDGQAWAWGDTTNGRLGNGVTASGQVLVPVQVTDAAGQPLSGVHSVQANWLSSFAVMSDGTARGWGTLPAYTGTGSAGGTNSRARDIVDATGATLTGVVRIGTGTFAQHALALRSDGSLWGWGKPDCNYLNTPRCLSGDGVTGFSDYAIQIRRADGSAIMNPRSFAAGGQHTSVVMSDGTVLAWGLNGTGALGDGTTISRNATVQTRTADGGVFGNVVQVVAGDGCTVFLQGDGSVWATGNNAYGCIGDGSTIDRSTPVEVIDVNGQPLTGVVELAAGWTTVVARKADGSLWVWGDITANSRTGLGSANIWRAARLLTGFAP